MIVRRLGRLTNHKGDNMSAKTENQKYNGWTNYETWNVKLWIDNDQGLMEYFNHEARHAKSAYDLGNTIKEFFEEQNPVGSQANVWADLMNATLREVSWIEIAEAIMDEVNE